MKSVKVLRKIGAVCPQWVRCGRAGCRCSHGQLHRPYHYLFWREGGRLRKRYVQLDAVPTVQAACAERREQERQARESARSWREKWRLLQASLREVLIDD